MTRVSTQRNRRRYPIGTGASPMPQGIMGAEYAAVDEFADAVGIFATAEGRRAYAIDRDNQLSTYESSVSEKYNIFKDERTRDPDVANYEKKYDIFFASLAEEAGALSNKSAKRFADNWLKDKDAAWKKELLSLASNKTTQNTKDGIKLAEFRAVQQRDPELIARPLERALQSGIISEAERDLIREKTGYDILLATIEDEAREEIRKARESGEDIDKALASGIGVVRSYDKDVKNLTDLNAISNRIEKDFILMLTGEYAFIEQTRSEDRVKAEEILRTPGASTRSMEQAVKSLEDEEQDKYKTAQIARAKDGHPKTDSKTFNDMVNGVLDYYENPNESEAGTQINDAYLNRMLSDSDKDSLTEYMGREYPADIMVGLEESIKYGSDTIPKILRLKGKDQQRIASYNRAVFDWLSRKVDTEKGTFPTQREVFEESRILANFYKQASDEDYQLYENLPKTKPAKKEKVKPDEITGTYGKEIKEKAEKDISQLTDEELDAEIEKLKKK